MKEPVVGFNKYCGPVALSIITGKNTDDCASAISRVNGQYRVKGVLSTDLKKAANLLGYDFESKPFVGAALFLTASMIARDDGLYVVVVPNHYIVLEVKEGVIELCDLHSKAPINLASSARGMQKVQEIYKVIKLIVPEPPSVESSVLEVEYVGDSIMVKRVVKYSDGTFKLYHNGTIRTKDKTEIQELAFALMKLTDKEV